MTAVHASPLSGYWYPSDRHRLRRLVEDLFEQSEGRTGKPSQGPALGYVVPHAGLMYSGAVAAAVYREIQERQPGRIIILGFSHRRLLEGVGVPKVSAISTPLGESAIDTECMKHLLAHPPFHAEEERWLCDHSVEIQLPLVQWAAPHARIVPLYAGVLDAGTREQASRALANYVDHDTIVLASSDFTHYGASFGYEPFPEQEAETRLWELDHSLMQAASSLQPAMFWETLDRTGATLCGRAPIALLLEILRTLPGDEVFQQKLDYQTSGEITGEFHNSVSYAALAYRRAPAFFVERETQEALMDCAEATIRRYQQTGSRRAVPPREVSEQLQRKAAVFVSIHQHGRLRGCVGNRFATAPLADVVPEMTLCAALDDPRFKPVSRVDESLDYEIHVLTPMKLVAGQQEWLPHQHGALLECGPRQSLLLPRVATDYQLTREQFFDALARKAGCDQTVYQNPKARLSVFRSQCWERCAHATPPVSVM